jgi:AcrR family transcriptional regulator
MELRRAILDASLSLISSRGLNALSMREVARRIGVTHGAPYHHFADRAAILAALTEEGFVLLERTMREAVGRHRAPAARFEASGVAYVDFAVKHTSYFRLMYRPELAGRRKERAIEQAAIAANQVLVGVVAECQAAGIAAGIPPQALALTGWATAHGLASLCVDGPLAGADHAAAARTVGSTLGKLLIGPSLRKGGRRKPTR